MNPRISVIICSFNGAATIRACLESVAAQAYPEIEVLLVDGGSTDDTLDIARNCLRRAPKIAFIELENPNRIPEGEGNGKWLGYSRASGEILAFIDQDNVLQNSNVFADAVKWLATRSVLGVHGGVVHDLNDSPVVRYAALFGTDSFFAYRSLGNFRTDASHPAFEEGDYSEYEMRRDSMLLAGGNCFFYRKSDLLEIGGYSQDVLTVNALLKKYSRVGILGSATKHFAARTMGELVKKKFMWGRTYFADSKSKFNYLPSTAREFFFFSRNLLFNLLVLPNFFYAVIIYAKSRDIVSLIYPFIAFLNTVAYGYSLLDAKLSRG